MPGQFSPADLVRDIEAALERLADAIAARELEAAVIAKAKIQRCLTSLGHAPEVSATASAQITETHDELASRARPLLAQVPDVSPETIASRVPKRRSLFTGTDKQPPSTETAWGNAASQWAQSADAGSPVAIAEQGTAGRGEALPHRDRIQSAFGHHDVSGIRAHVGGEAATASATLGARAFAAGNRVGFAEQPDLHTAAHEAAHVVQQRGGVQLKNELDAPGDDYEQHADRVADAVVAGESAEALLDEVRGGGHAIQRDTKKPATNDGKVGQNAVKPGGKDSTADGKDGKNNSLSWAGQGIRDQVTQSYPSQYTASDGSKVTMVDTFTAAHQGKNVEIDSDIVYQVERTYVFEVPSKHLTAVMTTHSHARIHNDTGHSVSNIRALVHSPTSAASNDGELDLQINYGTSHVVHRTPSLPTPPVVTQAGTSGPSLADLCAPFPLISFESTPQQKLEQLILVAGDSVKGERQDFWLDNITPTIAEHIGKLHELQHHIENYEDRDTSILKVAEEDLQRLREELDLLESRAAAGDHDPQAKERLARVRALYAQLEKAWASAAEANRHPPKKSAGEHVADVGMAAVHVGEGLVDGVVEIVKMGADVVRKGIDEVIQHTSDSQLDWEPYSAIGKAKAAGKTNSEIAIAMWDGLVDQVTTAIEHARHGDFSKLDNLVADIGVAVATMGEGAIAKAGTIAKGAAKVGAEARAVLTGAAKLSERLEALKGVVKTALKDAPINAKAWATAKLNGITEAIDGVKGLFAPEAVTANGLPSPEKFAGILREASANESIDAAMSKLGNRAGIKGARGADRVDVSEMGARLKKLADPDVAEKVARRMANVKDAKAYVKAVEKMLGTPRKIGKENLAAILEESTTRTSDKGAEYLENVYKIIEKDGLKPEARRMLIDKILKKNAPDLAGWINKTDLTAEELNFLAMDPDTNWRSFMKVSAETSDDYPQSLDKRGLKDGAYADMEMKVRGVAAEMVVDEGALKGFKLTERQIDVGEGRDIDFGGTDREGAECLVEVKSAQADTWERDLSNVKAALADKESGLYRLDKQLRAAQSTGKKIYLAVTKALPEDLLAEIKVFAKERDVADVLTIDAEEIKATVNRLKQHMKIGVRKK